jgi:hypothetical protein
VADKLVAEISMAFGVSKALLQTKTGLERHNISFLSKSKVCVTFL